jgi:hypothetical protein
MSNEMGTTISIKGFIMLILKLDFVPPDQVSVKLNKLFLRYSIYLNYSLPHWLVCSLIHSPLDVLRFGVGHEVRIGNCIFWMP